MNVYSTLVKRPFSIIGAITAIHSIVYGVGYMFGAGGFIDTVLYRNVGDLLTPTLFGLILFVVGVGALWSFAKAKADSVSLFSTMQSFLWLFATLVYMLNGAWLLGLGVGLVWAALSGYAAFAFKHQVEIVIEQERKLLDM